MKKNFFAAATILLLAVSLFSCRKETPPVITQNNAPASILISGISTPQPIIVPDQPVRLFWAVGSFIINEKDVTADYSNIYFQFQPGDIVMAIAGENTLYGRWYMTDNNHLFLAFDITSFPFGVLNDLNGTWTIIKVNVKSMYLTNNDGLKKLRLDMSPKGGISE